MSATTRGLGAPYGRGILAFACVAVAFAAADTYVVVVALPDMMTGVGLGIDQLQRATPIVSGFLLGYIMMLPLIGRIADVRGRVPVLVASLVVFAAGSLVTAVADDLATMVVGRFLQGVGGGGLVPATLALVADLWPVERRGVPLGVVGAVQELGSVLGPLYGAMVLAAFAWQAIFWLNVAVAVALALGIRLAARRTPSASPAPPGRGARAGGSDPAGAVIGALALGAFGLLLARPAFLTSDVTWGLGWVPLVGSTRWTSPLAVAGFVLALGFVVRELSASRPMVDLRALRPLAREADVVGAGLLATALACVVLAFAGADPHVRALAPVGPWLLGAAVVAAALFWLRQRSADEPMVPRGALTASPAWGSLLVSFFVGAALIAALVDIPVFARITQHPDSQLGAALVLLRFLAALPVGALVGGWLTRWVRPGPLTALGMALAAAAFVRMADWPFAALDGVAATGVLVLAGFGFGLAIAPVNAALLAGTAPRVHGIASALLIVARMIGMLVGVSVLTTIGLRRFYAVAATLPSPDRVCPAGEATCPAYDDLLRHAALAELHTIFAGAAFCAILAAALAIVVYRRAPATALPIPETVCP